MKKLHELREAVAKFSFEGRRSLKYRSTLSIDMDSGASSGGRGSPMNSQQNLHSKPIQMQRSKLSTLLVVPSAVPSAQVQLLRPCNRILITYWMSRVSHFSWQMS